MIPLSVPNISGNEWKYVKDCLDTGWISSAGTYVNKFEEVIKMFLSVQIPPVNPLLKRVCSVQGILPVP